MIARLGIVILVTASVSVVLPVEAQQPDQSELRRNVEIFSGVLLEGLELNETPNLFGINIGRINSVYLQDQGVVMEIRTPLANRRSRVTLNAMATSIQNLAGQSNPFALVQRPASPSRTMALGIQQESVAEGMDNINILSEIQAIDYSTLIGNALRQAGATARSLLEVDGLNQTEFNSLNRQLDEMRISLAQLMTEAREYQAGLSTETAGAATDQADASQDWQAKVDQLKAGFEQLVSSAAETASQLTEQYEDARIQYAEQWQAEVLALEESLYVLLCDYGASLRSLPENEHLTIVFPNLGDESSDQSPTDKVHVIRKSDLAACQSGDIDAVALKQRASIYSY